MDARDLTALTEELAALRTRLDEQDAVLKELRATTPGGDVTRRHLLRSLAGLGAAGVAGMVARAEPASAANGDPLTLGQANTASASTDLAVGGDTALRLAGDDFTVLHVDGTQPAGGIQYSAVFAQCQTGLAVWGTSSSDSWPAVAGSGSGGRPGLAGQTSGGGSQLQLYPEPASVGPPSSGQRTEGEIKLDANGDMWVCVGAGAPGTWTRLLREDTAPGRVIAITPFRALDTRFAGGQAPGAPTVPGQTQGPLTGGSTTTLDLAGAAGIPASATGVVGNVTAVAPTYTGHLTVRPAGTAPGTSTLNFATGTAALASAFTSQLTPTGLAVTPSGTSTNSLHLIVDITAYIT